MNKLFITFANSIGKPVAEVNPDGTKKLDNNGQVCYIPGLFRHSFINGNVVASVKTSDRILTGRVQMVEQEYQGKKFFTILGVVQNQAQATEIAELNKVQW